MMLCPSCRRGSTTVIDSRPSDDGLTIRRRRECRRCKKRCWTVEVLEEDVAGAGKAARVERVLREAIRGLVEEV